MASKSKKKKSTEESSVVPLLMKVATAYGVAGEKAYIPSSFAGKWVDRGWGSLVDGGSNFSVEVSDDVETAGESDEDRFEQDESISDGSGDGVEEPTTGELS